MDCLVFDKSDQGFFLIHDAKLAYNLELNLELTTKVNLNFTMKITIL